MQRTLGIKRRSVAFALIINVVALLSASSAFAAPATVRGKVLDKEAGTGLPFVSVLLERDSLPGVGTQTDLDGAFEVTGVEPGAYRLRISMVGYATYRVDSMVVQSAEVRDLATISLTPEVLTGDSVVVTTTLQKNNDVTLLKEREKAAAVSDAITAETISRSASGNAAEAVEKMTGASVVDGKYVYVRGLGDRYTNTMLNGSVLPSSDPDRNTVSMDVLPSKFLESIVAVKTFTPDQPGNFTGGSVNIRTTTFPEKLGITYSNSASYNSQVTGNQVLSYAGGGTDWLAIDDGTRDVPDPLTDPNVKVPDIGSTYGNKDLAHELDRLSKSFNSIMTPTSRRAPVNQNHALSLGNHTTLFGKPLGYFASTSYNRSFSSYTDGVTAQYVLSGNVATQNELTTQYRFSDSRGSEEVLWGGLAHLSFKPSEQHRFRANYIYNQSGESSARYQMGVYSDYFAPGTFYETRVLRFVERNLQSAELGGEHNLKGLANATVDWTSSLARSTQDEPDLRFFTNDFTPIVRAGVPDTIYQISPSNYPVPSRYYRDLTEDAWDSYVNMSLPFKQWSGLKSTFKMGGAFGHKTREFHERRYDYYQASIRYDGNGDAFFDDENTGIIDSTSSYYTFGNYIVDATQTAGNYDGTQDIYATYGMVDMPLTSRLRLITGLRFEATRLNVISRDTTKPEGSLSTDDILPSVNLVYGLTASMNARLAYSRTLARPTFRELAPYASFDFIGDYIFIGNPGLQRTLIDNYDLRWEYFTRPGEVLAVSGFYKDFENPIERAIVSNNNQAQFQNVDRARVVGLEFEWRTRLDLFLSMLNNFQMGGNLTLIDSKVRIPEKELIPLRSLDPNAPDERPLQGQSPYVLNMDIGYTNRTLGTSINAFYNVFGERLSTVSLGGTPNVYEEPRTVVDASVSQKLWRGWSFKASVKNLLDSPVRKAHTYKDMDYVVEEHKLGRAYAFGLSYSL